MEGNWLILRLTIHFLLVARVTNPAPFLSTSLLYTLKGAFPLPSPSTTSCMLLFRWSNSEYAHSAGSEEMS